MPSQSSKISFLVLYGKEEFDSGKNDRSLYGTPDISIKKYNLVIFIDSCFWHYCPIHGRIPKTNEKFWENKLKRNVEHDEEVTIHYLEGGWNIVRVWEHELKNELEDVVEQIDKFIKTKIKP